MGRVPQHDLNLVVRVNDLGGHCGRGGRSSRPGVHCRALSSRMGGGTLALGVAAAAVEGEGVRAMTGAFRVFALRMLHSCSRRMTSWSSRRAKPCLRPPLCMMAFWATSQRLMSCL